MEYRNLGNIALLSDLKFAMTAYSRAIKEYQSGMEDVLPLLEHFQRHNGSSNPQI